MCFSRFFASWMCQETVASAQAIASAAAAWLEPFAIDQQHRVALLVRQRPHRRPQPLGLIFRLGLASPPETSACPP